MTDEKKVKDEHLRIGEISDTKQEHLMQSNINTTAAEDTPEQSEAAAEIGTNVEQEQLDHTSKTPKELQHTKSKEKVDISSFEDFIANAYKLKGRKVSLSGKVQKQVAENLTLSEEAKQRIYALVHKDTLLVVPRQLLLAARDVDKYPRLKSAIFTFVRDILLEHPLFFRPDIENAIRNHEDAPSPIEVMKLLAGSDKSAVTGANGLQMKDSEFDKLRCNAVNCMAVWLYEKKGMSISIIADVLHMALWEQKTQLLKNDNSRLRALTEIGTFASVGLACERYRRQAMDERESSDAATLEANILRAKVMGLEDEIESRRETAIRVEEEHKTEKESLINETANLRNQAETEGSHLRYDLEKLRTRVLRQLKSDLLLLEDGLHALRRNEPMVNVMIDLADRVTDALREEIKNLEGGK